MFRSSLQTALPVGGQTRLRVLLGLLALCLLAWPLSRLYLQRVRASRPLTPAERANALLQAGVAQAAEQQWLSAVELLSAGIEAGAAPADAYRARGACLAELGWITDTIADYEQAIALDPTFFNTYISLATAYRSIGKRDEALKTLQKAAELLQSAPRDAPERFARRVAPQLQELTEAYARLGELETALRWGEQAQRADPTQTRSYLLAGKIHLARQEADQALPLLQRACLLAPKDPDTHYTLALALRARPGPSRQRDAFQHLISAIELNGQHAPALLQLGLLLSEEKEWEAALSAFERAYTLQFEPGTLLWRAGQVCQKLGDRQRAAFFLGQYHEYVGELPAALKQLQIYAADPKTRQAGLAMIARVQAKSGHPKAAIATLQQAIALAPDSAALWRQLAQHYAKTQEPSKQTVALETAARLDPKNAPNDFREMAKIAFEAGQHDMAERLQQKCIELAPSVGFYHYLLGQTYLMRPEKDGRLNKAIHELEEAQRLSPDSAFVHDFLSTAYMKAERWEEAVRALHRAINISAQNKILYYRLAQAYQHLGRAELARRAQDYYQRLRKIEQEQDLRQRRIKSRPDDPQAQLAMGELLLQNRDYAGARRRFEKAIDLQPNCRTAHERLVTIYGELSQPEGQWRHAQMARRLRAKAQ